jgi:DNA-binding GntR family transcriptional regulator
VSPVPASERPRRSRELLSDGVRRRLLTAILDGTLVAGERLHDGQLTEWLQVSRTPIRTALERLGELGLVEMEPNRYTRVARPTAATTLSALEVYVALHSAASDCVVSSLTEVDLGVLRARLGVLLSGAHGDGDRVWSLTELEALNDAVRLFAHRCGNPLLLVSLAEVEVRLAFALRTVPVPLDIGAVDSFAAALLRSAEARDPNGVKGALDQLLAVGAAAVSAAH